MQRHVMTFLFCCSAVAANGIIPAGSFAAVGEHFVFHSVEKSQCAISARLKSESDDRIDKHLLVQHTDSSVVLKRNAMKTSVLLVLSGTILAILIVTTVFSTVMDCQMDDNANKRSSKVASFSLHRNVTSLLSLDQTKSPNDVLCLHGMRAMCTFSIIYLHSYFFRVMAPVGDKNLYTEWGKTEIASRISSLNITVDTFFVISAMLLTKSMLKDLDR